MSREEKSEKKNELKPDKFVHKKNNMGTMAKKQSLPGQMYVPTKVISPDEFAGDKE